MAAPRTAAPSPASFGMLGPIEIRVDGCPVRLRGKMLPRLLATLLVHARRFRTADELVDDLWGYRPPASARESLYNHLSRLRRILGDELVVTGRNAYLLAVDAEQVDASRFESLL